MSSEGWSRVKEVAARAIDLPSDRRARFLDRACGSHAGLRAEVEALVRAHDEAGDFLAGPTADTRTAAPPPDAPGSAIGRYKLLQRIGEGGFGVVYMAEQSEPVRRRVALKLIKPGMDTRQVIARFEAERQALALMDHPNIARVFDAGETEAGRPYFVMELVRGVPITEYCDEAKLDTATRLDLFQAVCHAVQHAHQKGVIHRDIKPSNVLVTLHDGIAVPKIIDFGIAKALDRPLTEMTLFTEFRQMIGTPDYMAPEQAALGGLDIDTRADVYSLGVLLYELLTGTRPFDAQELRSRGYEEMLRTIREVDPPKPSTRLSALGAALPMVARNRHTPPRLLGRIVRGDLDWIAMKALEKDRSRRYETANSLALDVARYLADEPVAARAPSNAYRLRKYVRRHRVGVATATVVLVALLAGSGMATLGFLRARDKEHEARAEAGRAAAVQGFLTQMLAASDPRRRMGPGYTVRELLEDFDRRMEDQLATEPAAEAAVRTTIALAFAGLGLHERALHQVERALAVGGPALGPDHDIIADALRCKGTVLLTRGSRESVRSFQEALAMRRRLHDGPCPEAAEDLQRLGEGLEFAGRFGESLAVFREAIDVLRALHGERHRDIARALSWIAYLHEDQDELDEALELAQEAQAMIEALYGVGHPEVADAYTSLARIHRLRGEFETAERLAREALSMTRTALGADAPESIHMLRELGAVLWRKSKPEEAEGVLEEALALCRRVYGDRNQWTARTLVLIGQCRADRGRYDESLAALEEAEPILRATMPGHHELAVLLGAVGIVHGYRGEFDRALQYSEEALATNREFYGEDNAEVANDEQNLCRILANMGRFEEAETRMRRSLEILRRVRGDASPNAIIARNNLGQILRQLGRTEEAFELTEEALRLAREHIPDHEFRALSAANLATLVAGERCIELLTEAMEVYGELPGGSMLQRQVKMNLAVAYQRMDQFDEAAPLMEEMLPHYEQLIHSPEVLVDYLAGVVITFISVDRAADAEAPARRVLELRHQHGLPPGRLDYMLAVSIALQGKHAEAEPLLREALLELDESRWTYHWVSGLLGACLAGLGNFEEAEPLLLESYEQMDPPEALRMHKRDALERIVSLYEAWGREDRAAEWRTRRGT